MSVDGFAFTDTENTWPHFKEEPHKLKLSMVAEGLNPFGDMRYVYSVWHVFVINNNIPPWMSIEKEKIMFVMIVLIFFSFNSYVHVIIIFLIKWSQ